MGSALVQAEDPQPAPPFGGAQCRGGQGLAHVCRMGAG